MDRSSPCTSHKVARFDENSTLSLVKKKIEIEQEGEKAILLEGAEKHSGGLGFNVLEGQIHLMKNTTTACFEECRMAMHGQHAKSKSSCMVAGCPVKKQIISPPETIISNTVSALVLIHPVHFTFENALTTETMRGLCCSKTWLVNENEALSKVL